MNQRPIGFKTGSIDQIWRGTNLYVSNGDLLESTINEFQLIFEILEAKINFSPKPAISLLKFIAGS